MKHYTVLPVQVRDSEQNVYTADHAWHAALKSRLGQQQLFADGTILSVHDVQHDVRLKSDLHQATQAIAVDMESAAVARVALNANKPFVVVRTIFDSVSMRIPASSTNATDQYGQVSIPQLITGLIRKPAEVLQYPQMIGSFTKRKQINPYDQVSYSFNMPFSKNNSLFITISFFNYCAI